MSPSNKENQALLLPLDNNSESSFDAASLYARGSKTSVKTSSPGGTKKDYDGAVVTCGLVSQQVAREKVAFGTMLVNANTEVLEAD